MTNSTQLLCCLLNPVRECPACHLKMCEECYSKDTDHGPVANGGGDRMCRSTGKYLTWANYDLDDFTWVIAKWSAEV